MHVCMSSLALTRRLDLLAAAGSASRTLKSGVDRCEARTRRDRFMSVGRGRGGPVGARLQRGALPVLLGDRAKARRAVGSPLLSSVGGLEGAARDEHTHRADGC